EDASPSLRKCLICATPVTTAYYGIDACRACANFFKRSTLAGKSFICRQGDRKCVIVKDEKFMCRRCRFDRCKAAGMVFTTGRVKTASSNGAVDANMNSSQDEDGMSPSTSAEKSHSKESILQRIGREFNASVERRSKQELEVLIDSPDFTLAPHPTRVTTFSYDS
ncbi:hypothetical protein PFISCL1PPCAC_17118, partial [Pristionchus fissidentatus]